MATYYVDAQNGSDGAAGTSVAPWATLSKVASTVANGDTVYLSGTFRPDAATDLRDIFPLSLLAWSGMPPPIVRGDTVLTSWTLAGSVYTKSLAAGLSIASVVVDWDTSIDASGRHYGHLFKAATALAVASDDDSWFYDSGTGLLTIRIGANLDPAGFTVARCIGGVRAITMGSTGGTPATGVSCRGLTFYLWCDGTGELGYGLRYYTVQSSSMYGITVFDCGYHGTGWTNYGGVAATDNIESGTVVYGMSAKCDTAMVMYADTGAMRNCRIVGCEAHLYPLLGRDGAPILLTGTSTFSATGIACHSVAGGSAIEDFEVSDCNVVGYVPTGFTNRTSPYSFAGTPNVTAANRTNPLAYPARFVRCVATGVARMLCTGSGATIRCSINCSQGGASGAAAALGLFGDNADVGIACSQGHFGSELIGNLDGGAASTWLYRASGDTLPSVVAEHTLIGCTLYANGTQTNANVRGIFTHANATANITARGCLFAHRIPAASGPLNSLTHGNTTASAASLGFTNCAYVNISSTRYASATAYDTQAEWAAAIDPTGVYYGTTNPIADVAAASNTALSLANQAVRMSGGVEGVNGRAYSGHYGAWQYGKETGRLPRGGATVSNVAGALNAPRMSRGR